MKGLSKKQNLATRIALYYLCLTIAMLKELLILSP
jgi:hypothetical protein